MSVLVTGASGQLASALLPLLLERGEPVYALARRPPPPRPGLVPVQGDVRARNLGLGEELRDVKAVYHLAALVDLGERKEKEVWETNVGGTDMVVGFCLDRGAKLYHLSTAYTQGLNAYELSKKTAEEHVQTVAKVHGLKVVVFKPSILVAPSNGAGPALGPFYQFVGAICRVHRRAELVRRRVEGALGLPVLEPVFRIKGRGNLPLNLVPVDWVAEKIVQTREPGTYYLTNLNSPTLNQLARWIGEVLMLRIRFLMRFRHSPLEALFERMTKPFAPYLRESIYLPTSFTDCPPVARDFIQRTVNSVL